MKPAAGDKSEPIDVDGSAGNKQPATTEKQPTAPTNNHQAMAAGAKLPMMGEIGKAANKTGKTAGNSGKMPYSPSHSLHDWSDN
jgi:hypothetical protein